MTATAPYTGGAALPDPWAVVNSGGKSLNSMFNRKDEYGQNHSAPIGTSVEGVVATLPETFHCTDYDTKEPLYWRDGSPRLGIRFTADTTYREGADDDGRRSVSFQSQLLRALQDEMRAQGVKQFGVGTKFRITLVALEPTKKGFPKKIYKVDLQPAPLSNPAADAVLGAPASAPQQAPAQGYAPAVGPTTQQEWAPTAPAPQQAPAQQSPWDNQPAAPTPAQQSAPAAPSQPTIVTQEQIDTVQMLISRNIGRSEAILAVAQGDERLAEVLEQSIPF